jgi:gas vesicle protein
MKKSYHFSFFGLLLSAVSFGQVTLPVNFEGAAASYGLTDFGGNGSTIIVDPTNASNKVVETVKSNTADVWAGTTVGGTVGFSTAVPFTASSTKMRLRVYSPDAGIKVRLKVEDPNDATKSVETEATVTTANAWQTLEFNFANQATGTAAINYAYTYKKASVFFNFGVTGATAGAKTYRWDDLSFVTTPANTLDLPVDFNSTTLNYGLTDFGGNASTIITDPTNASNKVVETVKSNTAEVWAGTTVGGSTGFATAIPFSATATKMRLRVYSPDAGIKVRLKVEDPNDPAKSVETEATVTTANAWQTLEFNFANQATGTAAINYTYTYKKASVFFNFGVTGATAGAKTYRWDDLAFGPAPVVNNLDLPVDFNSTTLNYGLTDFGGTASTIITDPTNASNKVVETVKSNTAESWAGTTVGGTVGFVSAIPFTTTATKMRLRVYSPDAGIKVRLKVEDPNDPTKSVETEATVTAANTWQTLEFNFANPATGTSAINYAYTYKKASVFFNFGVTGATAGAKTYRWDDLAFGSATTSVENTLNERLTLTAKQNGLVLNSKELTQVDKLEIFNAFGQTLFQSSKSLNTNALIPMDLKANSVYFIRIGLNGEYKTFKALINE